MLENSYRQYKNKVKELYGDEADKEVVETVIKEEFPEKNIWCYTGFVFDAKTGSLLEMQKKH